MAPEGNFLLFSALLQINCKIIRSTAQQGVVGPSVIFSIEFINNDAGPFGCMSKGFQDKGFNGGMGNGVETTEL